MATDDFSEKFQGLQIKENQDINILLLGETGVGKSTFINSIANYLHFKDFKKAVKAEDLLILIPSVITVTNQNYEQVTLTIGSDNNEYQEIGAAGTQDVKTYVFPLGEGRTRLRLIDSPGMGDPRGIEQDDINCENILAYLAQLKELHAICFLMRPTTTRRTVFFEYCVKQILSRLEKSASRNIIFIFTNTRGANYSPGDTLPCLRTVIQEIKAKPPHVDIPLQTNNIFSLDNEAFRLLVATKKGVTFNEDVQQRFIESWACSAKECWRLISYIVGDASQDGLKPHQLSNTISINEARRIIVQLSHPLADISQLIHDNIRILDRHKRNLKMDNQSLDQLKKKLYIPIINLVVTQLTQPVTVCTSSKCAEVMKVGELQKWHYKQRCHDPCYLTNVTREIVGDTNLINCAAMNGGRICTKCTCDYSVHMHVYYMTKPVDDRIEDDVVKDNINKKEEALRESHRLIEQIDQRKKELEQERDIIVKSTAQFAHFLQHNAISPYNDSYKAYIEYLISREKSLGRSGDPEVVTNLEQLLRQHEEIKAAFENSLQLNQQFGLNAVVSSTVTAQSVMNTIHQLYQLKHNGKKIHELLKKQKAPRNSEYDKNCEYVHPKSSDLSHSESKSKKKSKTDDEGKKNKSKSDKKKGGKTDDEGRKDKPKSAKSTDEERKNKKAPYNKNFNPQQRVNQSSNFTPRWRDPPPAYDDPRHYRNQHTSSRPPKEDEPNVVIKVELGKPGKNQGNSGNQGQNQQRSSYGQPEHGYPPQGPYYTPQGPYYGPQYPAPPQGPYYGPPQYPYHGPTQGSYHGPPQGPYHGPAQGSYPPQGPYHGPAQGSYPPQGSYHGPPQGSYNRQYSGPPNEQGYQRYNQGNRGRGHFKRGGFGGGNRGRSRSQSRKSGNEKSSRSSDSDSSD